MCPDYDTHHYFMRVISTVIAVQSKRRTVMCFVQNERVDRCRKLNGGARGVRCRGQKRHTAGGQATSAYGSRDKVAAEFKFFEYGSVYT